VDRTDTSRPCIRSRRDHQEHPASREVGGEHGLAGDYSPGFVKFVGIAEILGALGLILPAVTGIAPVLVPIAASGLAVAQAGAIAVHVRRKEPQVIIGNLVLIALSLFVAWGRFGSYPL
jgi:hypothetical protein